MNGVPEQSGRRPLSYWQHCEAVSGIDIGEDKWIDARAKAQLLEEQGVEISKKLCAVGIPTQRNMHGSDLCIAGVFSGLWCRVTPWRHINFLPPVASANRRQLVKRLAYFGDSRPHLKYCVFTIGARCSRRELRDRLQKLSREISRYAAEPQLKEWGISVELRACEITAEPDGAGDFTYHPHANVILNTKKVIDWTAFLLWSHAHTSGKWEFIGRLIDPAEAIKYFVKPAQILTHNFRQTRELFTATLGLRLVEPMGNFRDLTKSLHEQRLKLGKRRVSGDVWKWCFVKKMDVSKKTRQRKKVSDRVMAFMPSQPRFSPFFEPCLLVRNFSGNMAHVLRENRIEGRFERARQIFNARKSGNSTQSTPSPQLSGPCMLNSPEKFNIQGRAGPRIYHLQPK